MQDRPATISFFSFLWRAEKHGGIKEEREGRETGGSKTRVLPVVDQVDGANKGGVDQRRRGRRGRSEHLSSVLAVSVCLSVSVSRSQENVCMYF